MIALKMGSVSQRLRVSAAAIATEKSLRLAHNLLKLTSAAGSRSSTRRPRMMRRRATMMRRMRAMQGARFRGQSN